MSESQTKTCIMRIRSLYSTFSEKEALLADYILESPNNIIHNTINQVAADLSLADSTVFRFCKKLGYKGFQEMKIALASETVDDMKDIHENVTIHDDEKSIVKKIFHSNMKTLEDTLKVTEEMKFRKAVESILNAQKIEFFGFGGSNIIAMDGYHKFIRTGLNVTAQTDSHLQLMSASQMKKGDVAILISHTGKSKDLLNIYETVSKNDVQTIGITGFTQSPLSQKVSIPLYTLSEETDYRSEALASRIAQLTLLDALYVSLTRALDVPGKESIQKMREAIRNQRI